MVPKRLPVLVVLSGLALLVAGSALAGRAAKKPKQAAQVVISTRTVRGLGLVLVDAKGRSLYMFMPDKRRRVTCVSSCAMVWPPLKLPAHAKAVGLHGVKAKLLGSDRDPAGGRVVTYAGWPLYTYVADTKAGTAAGQALNLNGGLWYVLSPSGKVIRAKPSAK